MQLSPCLKTNLKLLAWALDLLSRKCKPFPLNFKVPNASFKIHGLLEYLALASVHHLAPGGLWKYNCKVFCLLSAFKSYTDPWTAWRWLGWCQERGKAEHNYSWSDMFSLSQNIWLVTGLQKEWGGLRRAQGMVIKTFWRQTHPYMQAHSCS